MTNEERDIITRFIERVGGASTGRFGSGPGAAPPLPPIDKEADTLIGELLGKYPEARYRLTQTAFVQEHALAEAQNRIKRLEWELEQTKQSAAQQAQQQQPRSGGFLSGLFGGGQQQQAPQQPGQGPWNQPGPQYSQASAPPPPPQYAPGYQPGLFQRSGSGFLGSALTTAAGVAGGVVVGHALMDLFSPHQALGGAIPNLPESPWSNPGGSSETAAPADQYVDQGTWTAPDPNVAQNDPGYTDPGSWRQPDDQASWNDPGGDAGWTDDSSSTDDSV